MGIKFPNCSKCNKLAYTVVYGDKYTGDKVVGVSCPLCYDLFDNAHRFEVIKLDIYNKTGEIIGLFTFYEQVKLSNEVISEIIKEEQEAKNGHHSTSNNRS